MMFGTATKISNVQQPVVRRAVATRDAATIETELHIQILNADVMNDLIESALQESRIDGADRLQPFDRQTGSEGHAVLFRDAYVKRPIGKSFERVANAGAVRHGRGQRDDLLVPLHQLAKRFAKYLRVSRRLRCGLNRLAGFQIEGTGRVPLIVIFFRRRVTFTLGRQRVNDHRAVFDLLCFAQRRDQRAHVVAVNIADVFETQFVYQRSGQDRGRDRVFHRFRGMMQTLANGRNRQAAFLRLRL